MQGPSPDPIQCVLTNLTGRLHSPAFADLARHPEHLRAFTRSRKLPLPKLVACLCGFRGGSVQSEVDSFFAHMDTDLSILRRLSDRALAKARAKLHVPALRGLNRGGVQAPEAAPGPGECQWPEPAYLAGRYGDQGAGRQLGGAAQSIGGAVRASR